jgi:hypothetical protein
MQRDFLIKLSEGFVYDCLRWQLTLSEPEDRQRKDREEKGEDHI